MANKRMSEIEQIAAQLRMIDTAIGELQKLLPAEQSNIGSELQRLDDFMRELRWEYVDKPNARRAAKRKEQGHE